MSAKKMEQEIKEEVHRVVMRLQEEIEAKLFRSYTADPMSTLGASFSVGRFNGRSDRTHRVMLEISDWKLRDMLDSSLPRVLDREVAEPLIRFAIHDYVHHHIEKAGWLDKIIAEEIRKVVRERILAEVDERVDEFFGNED